MIFLDQKIDFFFKKNPKQTGPISSNVGCYHSYQEPNNGNEISTLLIKLIRMKTINHLHSPNIAIYFQSTPWLLYSNKHKFNQLILQIKRFPTITHRVKCLLYLILTSIFSNTKYPIIVSFSWRRICCWNNTNITTTKNQIKQTNSNNIQTHIFFPKPSTPG